MGKNIAEVLSILVKAIENNGEGKIADPLHFETEEAGLAHCQKLATLKPGDVFFSNSGGEIAMDNRTREKYRAQVRVMLHLLEGHRSRLPAGKPLSTALADGMAAAQALGFDLLTREARAMAGRTTAVGRGVEALHSGPTMLPQTCGIERSLPNGDA